MNENRIYGVYGAYRGDDEIGRLMHDFSCSDPDDMVNQDMADRARYYEETEGGIAYMCEIMEEMKKEVAEKVTKEVTKEVSVRTYITACREFGITDKEQIKQKILSRFEFLTEDQAEKYIS